jgi:hypothetical protein
MHPMFRHPLLRRAAANVPVKANAKVKVKVNAKAVTRASATANFPAQVAVAVTVATTGLLSACSGGDAGDADQFCGEIEANAAQLTQPNLQFSDDIEPLLDLYRDIGALAPLAIEPEWNRLTSAYETASTVVPGDPESEQVALASIFSTEESAAAVDLWLKTNCAVDIGPVFTIVAQND